MAELESDEAAFCEVELWQAVSQPRETMRQKVIIFFIVSLLYQKRPLLGQTKLWIMKKGKTAAFSFYLLKLSVN